MTPDPSPGVASFMRDVQRRLALVAAARAFLAAAVTALAASAAAALFALTTRQRIAAIVTAGLVVLVVKMLTARRSWTASGAALAAERAFPALQNQLVTALELERFPERAAPRMRAHIAAYAGGIVANAGVEPIAALTPIVWRLAAAGAVLAAAFALTRVPPWIATPAQVRASRDGATESREIRLGDVTAVITPPGYTDLPERRLERFERIEGIAGSRVVLQIASSAAAVTIDGADGPTSALPRDGLFSSSFVLRETGAITLAARDAAGQPVDRRLIPLLVRADAAPQVALDEPNADLILPTAASDVTFAAAASDDFALGSLTLHYTKVTGSGENFDFQEGRLPLTVTREGKTRWRGRATTRLTSLGLAEGDVLVVFARATDQRPGSEPAVSDSYVIEIGKPQAAIAGGFAVPPEEEKSAISLSALIRKTERLHAQRPRMAAASVAESAEGLAVEQRMVRSETLFTLGSHGHVEDEEEEAESSHEIQEGRLENRGQAEIRESIQLMTAAEKSLLAVDTAGALAAQRRALAALQRALSKQRYFLRTLPVRSRIDPTRRLTGTLDEAQPWNRTAGGHAPDRTVEAVRTLLASLAAAANRPLDGETAVSLAARALAVNPSSTALQDAARTLAATPTGRAAPSAAERDAVLARLAAALEAETRGVASSAAAPAGVAPSPLRGAMANAARARSGGTRP